jgi:hypothetical protein
MFSSFVIAGFDCTVSHNLSGAPINSRQRTQHATQIEDDYLMLRHLGITAVRDGATWSEIQLSPTVYDWAPLDAVISASRATGIDVAYDFCHFGFPKHLDVFSERFVQEFAAFCFAAARRIDRGTEGPVVITPLNEPSYFAWAAAHAGMFPPYCRNRAYDMKVQLVRAILAGTEAIWAAAPAAKILSVDPICRTVVPRGRPELAEAVEHFNHVAVHEAWDMISGKLLPELGGSPRHLGTIGINYYWTNQWEYGREDVPLSPDDERHTSLHALVRGVCKRYDTDILISETAHVGVMRASWLRQVAEEAATLLDEGVPLQGVCLYPILGMPSWHEPEVWLNMGLWDVEAGGERVMHLPTLDALPELMRLGGTRLSLFLEEAAQ